MMKEETTYHIPVLLMPSVDAMNIRPDGTYVDVTFGGGGHSREILSRLEDGGRLLSFDQDEDAERNIVNNPHFTFVRSNFRYLHNFLRYHGIEKVDAILADLGVSSHHFDDSERGFSFRFDGALDMRMNKRAGLTAADIVNTYEEEKLADIFYLYGEPYGVLKKQFALVRDQFSMELPEGKLELREYAGSIGHNYSVKLNGTMIGAIVDNMDLTVGNIMFDNAFLIVYDAKYLPQLTALAVMAARELARDKDGGLSNRS